MDHSERIVSGRHSRLPAALLAPILNDLGAYSSAKLVQLEREFSDCEVRGIVSGAVRTMDHALLARIYGRAAVLLAEAVSRETQGSAEDFAARVEFLVAALRQSQTLRDAVASMGRYNAMLPENGIAITTSSDGHGERIVVDLEQSLRDAPVSLVAVCLIFIVNTLSWLAGSPLQIIAIGLAAQKSDPALEVLGAPVHCGHTVTCLDLEPGSLDAPVSAEAWRGPGPLEVLCHDPGFHTRMISRLSVRVQRAFSLLTKLNGACPDRLAICAWLDISPSTLHRGLEGEQTSFSQQKSLWQHHAALEGIARGERISQIAKRVGFQDARSFRRAFRAWTGKAPSSFREKN